MSIPHDVNHPTAPPCRYRVAVRMLSPVLLLWVLVVAWKQARPRGQLWRFLRERLGIYPHEHALHAPKRWIHAASVGEVLTAIPLLDALIEAEGAQALLVTTTTVTGAEVLSQRVPAVSHRYAPIDLPGAVKRFIRHQPIRSLWIMETELWPWLIAKTKRNGTPLSIVNARLSSRTIAGAARVMAPVYADALLGVDVLARSAEDAARYRALGGTRVTEVGDLKLVAPLQQERQPSLVSRPYHLCASTHNDEEASLASAWCATDKQALLVIAPRHPDRGDSLATQLSSIAGHNVGQRSMGQLPEAHHRVYLADTLGELDRWYTHATTVFVGGSLVERGGHNLMEAARRARPISTGPHTSNFAEACQSLLAADALYRASDADAVVKWMRSLDATECRAMGERARRVALEDQAVLPRYLSALSIAA